MQVLCRAYEGQNANLECYSDSGPEGNPTTIFETDEEYSHSKESLNGLFSEIEQYSPLPDHKIEFSVRTRVIDILESTLPSIEEIQGVGWITLLERVPLGKLDDNLVQAVAKSFAHRTMGFSYLNMTIDITPESIPYHILAIIKYGIDHKYTPKQSVHKVWYSKAHSTAYIVGNDKAFILTPKTLRENHIKFDYDDGIIEYEYDHLYDDNLGVPIRVTSAKTGEGCDEVLMFPILEAKKVVLEKHPELEGLRDQFSEWKQNFTDAMEHDTSVAFPVFKSDLLFPEAIKSKKFEDVHIELEHKPGVGVKFFEFEDYVDSVSKN